jgi:hypothetical protein
MQAFNRYDSGGRHILTVLVCCLMFASAHMALHDSAQTNDELIAQDDCQVCRLNHVPFVPSSALALFTPSQVVTYILPARSFKPGYSLRFPTLGARAPPMS